MAVTLGMVCCNSNYFDVHNAKKSKVIVPFMLKMYGFFLSKKMAFLANNVSVLTKLDYVSLFINLIRLLPMLVLFHSVKCRHPFTENTSASHQATLSIKLIVTTVFLQ